MADERLRPYTRREIALAKPLMRVMSVLHSWVYRLSGGRVGRRFRYGAPVLLLTAMGRRSGRPRTTPLLYLQDGERLVVVASQGGMPTHPLWYLNLEANPEVEIQIRGQHRKMRARRASGEEKEALWPRLTAMYRDFDAYQRRTERDIPVVILTPR